MSSNHDRVFVGTWICPVHGFVRDMNLSGTWICPGQDLSFPGFSPQFRNIGQSFDPTALFPYTLSLLRGLLFHILCFIFSSVLLFFCSLFPGVSDNSTYIGALKLSRPSCCQLDNKAWTFLGGLRMIIFSVFSRKLVNRNFSRPSCDTSLLV